MELITTIFLSIGASALVCRLLIPFLMNHSNTLGLIDQPNARKVHQLNTPVIGGVAIVLTISIVSLVLPLSELYQNYTVWIISILSIFFTALMDDRFKLSAKVRLLIQLVAAFLVCNSGIRIESMYGLFGVFELPLQVQYLLTILVIVGVTNAFNLIDGIDGLAGGFTLVNFIVLGVLAYFLNQQSIMILCFSIAGATLSFLKFNFHPASIFMGDAGSMTIGFTLSSISIMLLQHVENEFAISPLIIILSILVVPVTDALRVFIGRYVKGLSLFHADKSHLHHLLLDQGYNHAKASLYLLSFHLLLIVVGSVVSLFISPTTCVFLMILVQILISKLFTLYKMLKDWGGAIKEQEFLKRI